MGSANLATQINVGCVVRLGANFLPTTTGKSKSVVIQATTSGIGWRPTLGLVSVVDSRGIFGPSGSRYSVFLPADDAAGRTSDEFGGEYPADSYAVATACAIVQLADSGFSAFTDLPMTASPRRANSGFRSVSLVVCRLRTWAISNGQCPA